MDRKSSDVSYRQTIGVKRSAAPNLERGNREAFIDAAI